MTCSIPPKQFFGTITFAPMPGSIGAIIPMWRTWPTPWSRLDAASRRKVIRLLSGEAVESFGLGRERTLQEYEAYAGLSFRHRKAQGYTLRGSEPPNPDSAADWPSQIYSWIARVRFTHEQLPDGALSDPMLWSLSILDEEGYEVCRRDVQADELAPLAGATQEKLAIVCEFLSETIPSSWTLWPLTRSGQWLRKLTGQFAAEDFAVLRAED
jgi:hypothetical protein